MAPTVEYVDHRRLIGVGPVHGAQEFRDAFRALFEAADDMTNRVDDVLGLRSDAVLVRAMNTGSEHVGGGTFERPLLVISVFGADGLITHVEAFDADREAEALARFDEIGQGSAARPAAASPAVRIENAATRTADRVVETWQVCDWDGYTALFAPGFRCFDRRKLMQVELDRDQYLDSYRTFFEMRSSLPRSELLATRGRRLALIRQGWEGADELVGPSELEWLMLIEVDDAGRRVAIVNFDPDDVDAAYTELDERYAAGEAAPHAAGWQTTRRFFRALAARDWEQLAAILAPDFVVEDHRPLGLLASLSADEYVASVRALLDLRPDATFRLEHVLALDDRRALMVATWAGSDAEGPFEIPVVNAVDLGPDGARRYHFTTSTSSTRPGRGSTLSATAAEIRCASRRTRRRGRAIAETRIEPGRSGTSGTSTRT